MAKIGYVRVSSAYQTTARQDDAMAALGVDRLFVEKVSGKREYNSSSPMFKDLICDACLDVSVLRQMERLAVLKMSKDELNENSQSGDEGILGIDALNTKIKAHNSQQ